MSETILFPPRLPPGPKNARMTACEVLTWIALGKAQTIEQLNEANPRLTWDTSNLTAICESLEGRLGIGGPEVWGPFCNTAVLDSKKGMQAGPYATKFGPAWLRCARANVRRERKCLVSYGDLLGELLREIDHGDHEDELIGLATRELLDALGADDKAYRIKATGRRRHPNGQRDSQAPITAISHKVFHDKAMTIDAWSDVAAGLYMPGVASPYHRGATFSDVSFDTKKVLAFWPVAKPRPGQRDAPRPAQSKVNQVMLEHAKAAAAFGCKTTQDEADTACSTLIPAPSIQQLRAAFKALPHELKRGRGEKQRQPNPTTP